MLRNLAQAILIALAIVVVGASTAIARELNEREIPTARVGKWHRTSVDRLLRRLEKLEVRSPPPPSNAEPK